MSSPMTFGRIVRTATVDAAVLIETVHGAGLRLPRHDHAHASLNLTFAGSYDEVFGSRSVASGPGTVVLKPAGVHHANRYGSAETRCVMAEFTPRASERIAAGSAVLGRVWTARGGPAALALRELWSELRLPDRASPLIMESCLWRVLGLAEREHSREQRAGRPRWLAWVEEFIRENAHRHRPLTLRELAAVADVHPGHLNKVFSRHFRLPVGRYLRRLQLERARRLLLESPQSLAQIAVESGFADQSHFTRVFKAYTGSTPAQYRSAAAACASPSRTR